MAAARTHRADLPGVCVPPDRGLSKEVENMGGVISRMGLFNMFDFSKKTAVAKAKEQIMKERP
eukprot:6889798-Pyramimonas_sp.AAC.1